jgi:hypothetical protein
LFNLFGQPEKFGLVLGPDEGMGCSQFIEVLTYLMRQLLRNSRRSTISFFRADIFEFLIHVMSTGFPQTISCALEVINKLISRCSLSLYKDFMSESPDCQNEPLGKHLINILMAKLESCPKKIILEIFDLLAGIFEYELNEGPQHSYYKDDGYSMSEESMTTKPALEFVRLHPNTNIFDELAHHADEEVSGKCYELIAKYLIHDV